MTLPPMPTLPEVDVVLCVNGVDVIRARSDAQTIACAEEYGRLCAEAERKALPEPPDDGELEEWRSAADKLLREHRSHEMRRVAFLLQNAYLFGRSIRARSKP